MPEEHDYEIRTDVKFPHQTRFDVPSLVSAVDDPWFNQSLCTVNDCVVRLGVVQGEFHWHQHDEEDELFFVLEGTLFLDLEGETHELGPQQGFTVSKGVRHRTRAPERVVMLMIERATVVPTGDDA